MLLSTSYTRAKRTCLIKKHCRLGRIVLPLGIDLPAFNGAFDDIALLFKCGLIEYSEYLSLHDRAW